MTTKEEDLDATTGESEKADFASARANQVKLRIDEDQFRHVQKFAAEHHTTINATVRWLIDRGIEGMKLRTLNEVADDIEVSWARFGDRLLALANLEDLFTALAERRYEDARAFARELRKYQVAQAQKRLEKLS
jgi:hypothetical protein